MTTVIGLDLGTSNCKAAAINDEAKLLATASCSHSMDTPKAGWATQNAEAVWESAKIALSKLIDQLKLEEVSGLCLSGAMHSLVPVGTNDQPLAAAMTWADQRSAEQAKQLRKQTDSHELYLQTGCPLVFSYHPAKLRWWQENGPEESIKETARYACIKDIALQRLVGEWATDEGLASTTGMYNIHKKGWDMTALQLARVSSNQLPEIVQPTAILGTLRHSAAQVTGLSKNTIVVAGAHDGGLANIGVGAASPEQIVISVGTSGAVRFITSQPLLDKHERTWCYLTPLDQWLVGGAINNGGLAIQWVRERFYADIPGQDGYQRLMADASQVPAGASGLLFLPYLSGERSPYWDPNARAALSGLGLEHSRAHIARAALEAVVFCLADVWQAITSMKEDMQGHPIRLSGEIVRSQVWSQIVADVLGVEVLNMKPTDASAIGAAMLGHHALDSARIEQLARKIQPKVVYEPDPRRHVQYGEIHQRFQWLHKQIQETPNLERKP